MELLDVPDPRPEQGEVLLRVGAAAVCGSDVARYAWTRNYEAGGAKAMGADLPRIMGHEFAGTVEELGPGVTSLAVGDRVVVQNILACSRCAECDRGLPNLCRERRTLGVHRDGGYAELVVVPERNATPMPDGMDMHLAAGLQPFAVATYAVQRADLRPGDRILVWGLGPIGLAVILAARLRGVETALALDRVPVRLVGAGRMGIPAADAGDGDPAGVVERAIGRRSVDAVFEAAGAPEVIPASLPILRKDRPMILIGNLRANVDADLMPLIMDQQRLVGTRSYSLEAWSIALRTVQASGFAGTLGDVVGLDEAIDRFELAVASVERPFAIVPDRAGSAPRPTWKEVQP
jgi:threonine dehydrogenase-like Zn-dependent dehydrogenase